MKLSQITNYSTWLHNIARGIDLEVVTPRFYSKSIGCCKKFPGRNNITGLKTLQHWLGELASEINDRLEKDFIENNRKAKQMVVQFVQDIDGEEVASSRSSPLNHYDQETLSKQALELIKANTKIFLRPGCEAGLNNAIRFLGISVGKFETASSGQNSLQAMFANQAAKKRRISVEDGEEKPNAPQKPKETEETRMKSFFANYLKAKNDNNKLESKDEKSAEIVAECNSTVTTADPKTSSEQAAPSKKSFFEQYKQKLIKASVIQASEDDKSVPSATPPEFKESFFAKYLQKQKDINKSNEQLNESAEDNELSDMHGLAAELDEVESSIPETKVPEKIIVEPKTVQPSTSKRKFEEVSRNSPPDYKSSYAEFAHPELDADLVRLVSCDECGVQIPDDAQTLQSHRDHHFAQHLSRRLRDEQREELQRSRLSDTTASVASPIRKPGSVKNSKNAGSTRKPVSTITKFLTARHPEPPASCSGVNMDLCAECKTYIKSVDMPEHLDFHIAKKLQRELNQLEVRTVHPTNNKKISPTSVKKPLNSTLNLRASNKSIAQFFTQSN